MAGPGAAESGPPDMAGVWEELAERRNRSARLLAAPVWPPGPRCRRPMPEAGNCGRFWDPYQSIREISWRGNREKKLDWAAKHLAGVI